MPAKRHSRTRSTRSTTGSSAPESSAAQRALPASSEARPHPLTTGDSPPAPEVLGLEYYRDRFAEFCRDCLQIVDKSNQLIPFVLNSTQRKVLEVIERQRAAGIPPRLAILKARQVGISTLIEALIFHACLCNPYRQALVIAHNLKSSRVLFRMGRCFYNFLPEQIHQEKRIDNEKEIEFDSGARMQVEVQGDPRGYAAQDIHLSEFAFYTQAEDTLVAVMQALPRLVGTLGVIESTANGVGNKFHRLWQRASGLALDSDVAEDEKGWTPIFIPWFQHEEYRVPLEGKPFNRTSEETRLMIEHKLDDEQLKWRRVCISSNLDGDEDKFAQEYPATPEEAFALSGRPAFDTRAVLRYTQKVAEAARKKEIPPRMEIESDPPGIGEPVLVEYDRGRLRIFAQPLLHHSYIVGADPSEGDPGSDHSPLAVLDQQTLDFVATWYGKAPPDLLACHAVDLARYYRNALIIHEANNHGILFGETVRQLDYHYLFHRRVSEESVSGAETDKPGYMSTIRNREHLFNTLRKYVRMEMGKIPCPHFVQQMQGLVYVDNKAQAQAGAEKDMLIAGALCLMAHRGSMANPLEPLSEELVRSVSDEVALIRERNPDLATKIALDRTGRTQEECDKAMERILERENRRRRFGLAGMR